jgi:hypothetical protein
MASKKQRRRRAKEQRHDYVWIDDEGNELDRESARDESSSPARSTRGKREPQAPSWIRTFKRAAIFAPIMFGTVLLLSPKLATETKITQTLLIVGIFVPFSYFVDRLMYRSYLRRQERARQPAGRRGS